MQKNKTSRSNQLRIIGGTYRSRKLTFPSIPGLRPTGDRIRETLFNWLAPHIVGSNCLDLFAGSGALGIEALSRGARTVTFVDSSQLVCETIRNNLNILDPELIKTGRASVICANSPQWLSTADTTTQFNIVFLDPPFSDNLIGTCIEQLDGSAKLKSPSLIYVESSATTPEKTDDAQSLSPPSWVSAKSKHAGNVCYQLFCRN